MLVNDKTGQPANDNHPCSTLVLAPRQRIGEIKLSATLATAAPANDNGVNATVHRDSVSNKQISPSSMRNRGGIPILRDVASALRKSERWLRDWLKKNPHDQNGRTGQRERRVTAARLSILRAISGRSSSDKKVMAGTRGAVPNDSRAQ